jgi:hypothetical protein
MQNIIIFLLWLVLLTKVLQEWLKSDKLHIFFWIKWTIKFGVEKVKWLIIWNRWRNDMWITWAFWTVTRHSVLPGVGHDRRSGPWICTLNSACSSQVFPKSPAMQSKDSRRRATSYLHVVLEPPLLIIYNHLHEFLGVFEKVINVTFWAGNLAARCFRVAHDGGRTSCLHDTLHSCKFHLFKNQRLPDNLLPEDCLSRFG